MNSGLIILATGPPGCGKSTLIEKIAAKVDRPKTGFYTREIREHGQRAGFSIITMEGRKGVLAHKDIKSRYRVGRYGVNIEDIEALAVPALQPRESGQLVIIDEIGKMECFSAAFRQTLLEVMKSGYDVLGSISLKGDQFIQRIKALPDVEPVRVTLENRDRLVELADRFRET